jgi:hypothetical protein
MFCRKSSGSSASGGARTRINATTTTTNLQIRLANTPGPDSLEREQIFCQQGGLLVPDPCNDVVKGRIGHLEGSKAKE